ncbi:MAG: CrcB family protein [Lentisphaerae bacterium]|nr:CrcB family protein [Lentisphaerota bacterium]
MTNFHSCKLLAALMMAGALGTLCRYLTMKLAGTFCSEILPWGTIAVNLGGAFLGGLILLLVHQRFQEFAPFLPVLTVGFLGGFTTFSSFAMENAVLLQQGAFLRFSINALLQNLGGIAAVFAGMGCARLLL